MNPELERLETVNAESHTYTLTISDETCAEFVYYFTNFNEMLEFVRINEKYSEGGLNYTIEQ